MLVTFMVCEIVLRELGVWHGLNSVIVLLIGKRLRDSKHS